MQGHQPHPATLISDAAILLKRGKKRGNYNCGRCGVPKRGHKCPYTTVVIDDGTGISTPVSTPRGGESEEVEVARSVPQQQQPLRRRRALSFEDFRLVEEEVEEEDVEVDLETAKLPASCLWEVLRRLPPAGILAATRVCKGWRDTTKRLWRATEELRLKVPSKVHIGFVGSVLQKCPGIVKLSIRMERDVDATILACIAFSCRNLQSLEILTSESSVNWISGDELSRFISEKRSLTNLKMERCSNLGVFACSSTTLSTLWLSDLHSVSKMVFNCPNLKEISLEFSRQENDSTNLPASMDALARSCPKLQNIHIASIRLSNAAVLALTAANLRGLRMLSLVLGSEITDASVAAIASSFTKLELLDLSGSSITDSGIGMICNVFPESLSKLLLALCPNITSSGIQFAAAQMPRLELLDCGMTICDPDSDESLEKVDKLIYQKLIIKHSRLKKLSLWGCSGLDALYLNCPHLNDLNLNSCRNLHPERLLLQCPNLESVHASDCQGMLVKTIETQVTRDSTSEGHFPLKRLPDGSKRVRAQYFSPQPSDSGKNWPRPVKRRCAVILSS